MDIERLHELMRSLHHLAEKHLYVNSMKLREGETLTLTIENDDGRSKSIMTMPVNGDFK